MKEKSKRKEISTICILHLRSMPKFKQEINIFAATQRDGRRRGRMETERDEEMMERQRVTEKEAWRWGETERWREKEA